MPTTKLGNLAKDEIRQTMRGLHGPAAAAMAETLASKFEISVKTVYRLTNEFRQRKPRADRGQRRASLLEDPGLALVTELVVQSNWPVHLAVEAAGRNGHQLPVSTETASRYLRESGVNRSAKLAGQRAYRPWEAERPGDIFQFDISGLKLRYLDARTRKLLQLSELDVSKNHPLQKPEYLQIWRFVCLDDRSRRLFIRYYAANRTNSFHVVDFLFQAFRALGVPKMLYTDNDATIVGKRIVKSKNGELREIWTGKRMRRAAEILNELLKDSGGFRCEQHRAGNARATGKVERSHKTIEGYEVLVSEFPPTLDALNQFGDNLAARLDREVHRGSGEIPLLRWQREAGALRLPPSKELEWAFKADEYVIRIAASGVVALGNEKFQVPRTRPFVDWFGQDVQMQALVPPGADWWVLIDPFGAEHHIEKQAPGIDVAGEFKTPALSTAQQIVSATSDSLKKRRARQKESGERLVLPVVDDLAPTTAAFPKPKREISDDEVREILGQRAPAAPAPVASFVPAPPQRLLTFWEAFAALRDAGFLTTQSDEDKAMLREIFGEEENLAESVVVAEFRSRKESGRDGNRITRIA